ncbi:MAG TPA: hypothetical protein VF681_03100 [Abditibacteriaceae bacterium]|jgi:hypothetical protein
MNKQLFFFGLAVSLVVSRLEAQIQRPQAPRPQPQRAQPQRAQVESRAAAPEETSPALVAIGPRNLASLPAFAADNAVRVFSLAVTRAQLEADDDAVGALQTWVRNGGVVFLHTDAAQLFGYSTVVARRSTPQRAGQLFGRARADLSFGAHPLLWGMAGRVNEQGQETGDEMDALAGASAVRTIYYRAQAGDHFVTEHPSGLPLLRLVDVAGADDETLYAAAIAPYGRGWAIFTPSLVEPNRADGNLFAANLLRFAGVPLTPEAAQAPDNGLKRFVPLAASWIEGAATAARDDEFDGVAQIRTLDRALAPPVPTATTTQARTTETVAPLAVTFAEANAIRATLRGDETRARAMLLLLQTRLALQSGEGEEADNAHAEAEKLAPDALETLVWGGVLSATEAEDRTLASPSRATLMNEAAEQWADALRAQSLLRAAPAANRNSTVPAGMGVPRELVELWSTEAARSAQLLAVEPPLVTAVGNFLIRHYADDASLRLALPAAAALTQSSQVLGMAAESEELVLFPSPEIYAAYRAALGLGAPTAPAPGGVFGDVVGSRMLMISQPATLIFLPPATPGGPPRPFSLGSALPSAMARLHAQILANSLTADGEVPPAWMLIGLANVSDFAVTVQTAGGAPTRPDPILRRLAATNALLTPAQFEDVAQTQQGAQTGIADAQALRLMQFFYERFGAGAVVETFQRLGSGQTIDEALQETTELSEAEFFSAWANAEFGL